MPKSFTNSDIFQEILFSLCLIVATWRAIATVRQENEISRVVVQLPKVPIASRYATIAEVKAGLEAFSDADYTKLMMIAISFCRQRRLGEGVCEPEDLLQEAVVKTLEYSDGKRWNKEIPLVRHLDRAMENISGHLAKRQKRMVPFQDGLNPDQDSMVNHPTDDGAEQDNVETLLSVVFGDDVQAKEVIIFRAQEIRPNEIQLRLGIDARAYETINRRILRKIAKYVKQNGR